MGLFLKEEKKGRIKYKRIKFIQERGESKGLGHMFCIRPLFFFFSNFEIRE